MLASVKRFQSQAGLLSQIAFSGSNFVLAAVAALTMDVDDVASFALVSTLAMWLSTLMNAWIIFPYALIMPGTVSDRRRSFHRSIFRTLGVGLASVLSLFIGSVFLAIDAELALPCALYGAVFLLRHEQRSAMLAEERPLSAFITEVISSLFVFGFACVVIGWSLRLSARDYLFLASFLTLPSLVVGLLLSRGFFPLARWALFRRFRRIWVIMGYEMTKGIAWAELMSNSYVYFLGALGRHSELALIFGCNLLFRHVAVISNGLANAIRPQFSKMASSGQNGLVREKVKQLSIMMSLIALATVVLVSAYWGLMHLSGDGAIVPNGEFLAVFLVLGTAYILLAGRMPAFIYLQCRQDLSFLTRATAFAAIPGGAIQLLGAIFSDATLIAAGIAISNLVFTMVILARYVEFSRAM